VIRQYSTFDPIQERSARRKNNAAPLPNSERYFITNNSERGASERWQVDRRTGRRAGKRICSTAIANSSYKEALQKSRTGATRKPVARAVSSVRVGECKRAHEGGSTSAHSPVPRADNAERRCCVLASDAGEAGGY